MSIGEILAKKRDGLELTPEEIAFFVQGVVSGSIPDYQASAWLMAVRIRGMTDRETLALTLAMRDSGEKIDLTDLPGRPALDKHSTGGVGDKTTLIVVPILAAAGVPMLKMSGRGLGFSGGTIDKLEAIPGFRCELSNAQAKEQVREIGAALIAQSKLLAPADKILYALRDVTATIESIPLIASSIMSKKLAAGADRIVLDVKVGKGAFMKTMEEAQRLASALERIGNQAGVPTFAFLTEMNEPLGYAVGNALEVKEAWNLLKSPQSAEKKLLKLCLTLAAHGLVAVGKCDNEADGIEIASKLLHSGDAARKFEEVVVRQGGDLTKLPLAPIQIQVFSPHSGTLVEIIGEGIGRLAMEMGAGRSTKQDVIDPATGIVFHRKTGDFVNAESPFATLHVRQKDETRSVEFTQALLSNCRFLNVD